MEKYMSKWKTTLLLAGVASLALMSAAHATLQIAFTDGSTVVTCADGQACDLAGPANNIIILNTTVGAFHIIGTVAASVSGTGEDNLQFSTSLISNSGSSEGHLSMIVGDTNFVGPVNSIRESASLTFNDAAGSGPSTLSFFADPANGQPAGIGLSTPGTLLDTVSGSPTTNPESFAGSKLSLFSADGPFSMTEAATLTLLGHASVTGFNESMESAAVPEPSTWAMLGLGFGMMAFFGIKRSRKDRLNVAF
jgi:PEP-CTERM motif